MDGASVDLLIATRNAGKVREFRELFAELPDLKIVTLVEYPNLPDVIEDGDTFEANAMKKAMEIAVATGLLVLADDSGLEVDALDGRPGVYSARYAGVHGKDEANNDKLLAELANVADEKRSARYRVVLALADTRGPLGKDVHFEIGACEGTIRRARSGSGGFGYDPLFQPADFAKTMAELTPAEKNQISHRALATRKMQRFLSDYLARRRAST